jgi:general secretion pathway protein A
VPPRQPHATKKELIDRLNQRLLADSTNRPFVVIIDDAQTMTPETLEDLRLLSNLETDKRKLIQVVLSGQPELLEMLADDRLRQLKQRIAVHCRLEPLSVQETGAYISRRLFVAGNKGQVCFSPAATRRIHKRSGGIPRLINKICDFALTAGYVKRCAGHRACPCQRAAG